MTPDRGSHLAKREPPAGFVDLTAINLDQPRPAYRIIAGAIADEIRAGRLKPGQRIPSARTIAHDVGVSLRTADAALRVLREDSLTVSVHGLGTFVAEEPTD